MTAEQEIGYCQTVIAAIDARLAELAVDTRWDRLVVPGLLKPQEYLSHNARVDGGELVTLRALAVARVAALGGE